MRSLSLALAVLSTLGAGCVFDEPPPEEAFDETLAELEDEFGNGKADLLGALRDPCALLDPLLELGDAGIRAGVFVGASGEAVLGPAVGFGGMDLVWDLYNQQFTVARYKGAGIAVPGAIGGSVQAYAGVAFGFQRGVAEWYEYFVTGSVQLGLPFLKDYASINTAGFVSGIDYDGDHVIDPSEVLAPPEGVFGVQVGVQLGIDILPDPLPVSGAIVEGYWRSHDRAIRHYYDQFRSAGWGGINARLVDEWTGEPCPANWPDDGSGARCVIELGDPDDSWVRRSLSTARSICHATGRCAVPLSWPLSATAVAIGAVRSSGLEPSQLCER